MRKIDWLAGALLLTVTIIGSFAAVGVYHIGMIYTAKPTKLACYLSEATQ